MPAASLILAADAAAGDEAAQLFLFHAGELPAIDRTKPRFHCTGERLFRDRPEIYRLIVSMRGEGLGIRQTIRACHASAHTIKSVEDREAVPIATEKRRALKGAARVCRMSIERIEELIPTGRLGELAMVYGIAFDKVALGSGDPTMRLELARPAEGILERLERLRAELIGSAAENGAQKALTAADGAAGGDPGAAAAVATLKSAGSDLETDAFRPVPLVDLPPAAELAADPAGDPAAVDAPTDPAAPAGEGGRGSKSEEGGRDSINGRGADNFMPKGGSDS